MKRLVAALSLVASWHAGSAEVVQIDASVDVAVLPRGSAFDADLVPLERKAPRYPRAELLAGTEGFVTLMLSIDTEGRVENAEVAYVYPRGSDFERAALRAVRDWRFLPRKIDGRPVPRTACQTINFQQER